MQKSITAPMILKKITIPYPRPDPCCLLAHNKVDDEIVDSDKMHLSSPHCLWLWLREEVLWCGSRTGRCPTRWGDCTGVCFLLLGDAGQSAIEPNSIPSEIKQRALPQTRPYDDCVAATYNWAHNKQQLPLDADVLRPVISTMQSQS